MVQKVKINTSTITPIKVEKIPSDKIQGYEFFPELYSNIFLMAKKHSGKTNVVFNIIKACANKHSKVIVFCNTHNNDANWRFVKGFLDFRKIESAFYDSILDGKQNILNEVIEEMKEEDTPKPDTQKRTEEQKQVDRILGISKKEKKEKEPKKKAPRFIIVFDDLPSTELRNKSVDTLLKQNRHFKSKVIISSQWVDLNPAARRQIQYYLLFKGINEEKLDELYKNMDLDISYDKMLDLYKDATQEKYNFFYISTDGEYRHNFNEKYDGT